MIYTRLVIIDLLFKFLKTSGSSWEEKIKNKLWIIFDQSVELVFDKVERRIKSKIPDDIRMNIKRDFSQNLVMINCLLNKK